MILKFASAIALALVSVPAVPQSANDAIPIDTVDRAKFPNEDGAFVDALNALNTYVNQSITYETDMDHYGLNDFWVMAPTDGKGDCEDIAETKIFLLSENGFPVVTNVKFVMVMVAANGGLYGHAIVAVLMPHGSVAYLDMRKNLMTRAELEAKGYQFQDWKA